MKKEYLDFKVIINLDENGIYVANCPAIPGCHTQGDTFEEAEKNIKEAIVLCLKVAEEDKDYRDTIDFGQSQNSRFIGISEIFVPRPNFV